MRAGYRLLAVLLISVLLFSLMPRDASAIPFRIEGYLRDGDGNPIPRANITIIGMIYDPGVQAYVEATSYVLTDNTGYFRLHIAAMEPGGYDQGSKLTVSYSTDTNTVRRVITVQGNGAWANLTYTEKMSISEMVTSPVGVISVVVLVSAISIGYFIYRKPDEPGNRDDSAPKRVERRRRR